MLELSIAAVLLALLAGLAIGVWCGYRGGHKHADRAYAARWGLMLEELSDLRHLKRQLEKGPPLPHDHIWPREPDVRKMGWHRYRCIRCREIKWVAA